MTIPEFKIDAPNFTQMPNILLDKWLPFLKEIELKVLLTIYRKTFGWQKRKDVISLSQLMKSTGSSKTKIIYAVDLLVEKKLISKVVIGGRGQEQTVYEIIISEPSNSQVQEGGCPKVTGGGVQKSPGGSDQKSPTKEMINKYINKKENITKESPTTTGAIAPLASTEAHKLSNFSKEVIEILELLKKSLKSLKADYKITVSQEIKWSSDIDKMLKIDKRAANEVKQVVSWVAGDSFWAPNIKSGEKLRKQYDSLFIKMNESQVLKNHEKYKIFANKVKNQGRKFNLNINNLGIYDPSADLELTYHMPYEDFCRCIAKAYGISNYERDM